MSGTRKSVIIYAIAALLAVIGLIDSLYLTIEHLTGRTVQCTLVSGCSEVLSSPYAVIGGVPLAAVGASAYFTVFSLAILAAFGYGIAGRLLTPLTMVMFLVSLWLIYLQACVIRAFCQFCLLSAAISLSLLVGALIAHRYRVRYS